MLYRPIIRGLLGYIPGFLDSIKERKERTGTISARYCYSVWLRHLVLLEQTGMKAVPQTIAEIGPGASLGIGLSAMLSGVNKYFAFDIIHHANVERNLKIFEELINLFQKREDIPGENEFPSLSPKMPSYKFPNHILTNEHLSRTLEEERLNKIRNQIINQGIIEPDDIQITYKVPWCDEKIIQSSSVDLIISQAVLEHVLDLNSAFHYMNLWLKSGGYLSHQIDYKAHETHKIWNGHWFYNNLIWKVILKGRAYPINRQPHSKYLKLLKEHGFELKNEIKNIENNGLHRQKHMRIFPDYEKEDFLIKGALLQSIKY